MKRDGPAARLGLGPNIAQFSLLVLVNAFVGGVLGLERVIVPLLAESEFGIVSSSAILSFLVSFGAVKALANLFAGRASDRWGRRRVLIIGWLFGVPIPFLLMFAPSWGWIVFANVLLGINQGLCWSATVIMKIDLAGPKRRGLAMGLNEFAGYVSVSIAAFVTGYLAAAHGLRPVPFYPGVVFVFLGLGISLIFIRETKGHVEAESQLNADESKSRPEARPGSDYTFGQVFRITSWKNRALFAASQAGMVNNLNDGVV